MTNAPSILLRLIKTTLLRPIKTIPLKLKGIVERGIGKGKHYVSIPEFKRYFKRLLGTEPYPGTLNVRLRKPVEGTLSHLERLKKSSGISLEPFKKDGITYHTGTSLHCTVFAGREEIPGVLFFPEKTIHSPDVVEVIAGKRIMDLLSEGDLVEIEVKD